MKKLSKKVRLDLVNKQFTLSDYYCRIYSKDLYKMFHKRYLRCIDKIIGSTVYFSDGSACCLLDMVNLRLKYRVYRKSVYVLK